MCVKCKCLLNLLKATMDNERLANLALLHTHYDQQINMAIDMYDMYAHVQMHPRIELETSLKCIVKSFFVCS